MSLYNSIRYFIHIGRAQGIVRRYFVVNGFDGALTVLGLVMGFYVSDDVEIPVIISACIGAAIALTMSGISSAYISEAAEKKKELHELERAMATSLSESIHGSAARLVPWFVALINGLAPLLFALFIILPLFLAQAGISLPVQPLLASLVLAFLSIFMLGVFLGRISNTFWLLSGVQAILVAVATALIIYWLGQ